MTFAQHHEQKIFGLHAAKYFGTKLGAIVVLKRALYGLKTTYNSFRDFFGDLLINLVFNPSREYQDLWLRK